MDATITVRSRTSALPNKTFAAIIEAQAGAEALLPPERVKVAQEIAGLAGWIATCARPDGYFAFVALSQFLAAQLTPTVWNALLRWAWYLVNTEDLRLVYREGSGDWVMYADSSLFNNEHGGSFGGFAALFPDSGAFAWKSFVPRKIGTSSGAAETTMAAFAVQYAVGLRMMDRELKQGSDRATVVYSDNLATLKGTAMDNVPGVGRQSRRPQARADRQEPRRHVYEATASREVFAAPRSGSRLRPVTQLGPAQGLRGRCGAGPSMTLPLAL